VCGPERKGGALVFRIGFGVVLLVAVLLTLVVVGILAMVHPERWLGLFTSFTFIRFLGLVAFGAFYLIYSGLRLR
jgi:hypothetical protein